MLAFFAQVVEAVPTGWERVLKDYGFSGTLTLMVLWLMYRYVPREIEGVLSLHELLGQAVQANAKSQKRTAVALKKISAVVSVEPSAVREHPFSSTRVEQSLLRLSHVIEEAIRDNPELKARVQPHLEAIREALRNREPH